MPQAMVIERVGGGYIVAYLRRDGPTDEIVLITEDLGKALNVLRSKLRPPTAPKKKHRRKKVSHARQA